MKYPTFHDKGTVYHTDLLTLCGELARRGQQVDMILCDLPYGQTACAWDEVIPFEPMWTAFKRIIKPKGAIVLTASQPFTSTLTVSNINGFRHEWVMDKKRAGNFLNVNNQPLKVHESILVFSQEPVNYYPVMTTGKAYKRERRPTSRGVYRDSNRLAREYDGERYPISILEAGMRQQDKLHPTQKPVDLFRYLIRTYTQPGELVFDPCCGSATTGIAAREEGRRFILGDSSAEYIQIARKRLDTPYTLPLFAADRAG